MPHSRLRQWIDRLRRTPLHPQWLLTGEASSIGMLRAMRGSRLLDIGCADRWVERQLGSDCTYLGLDYPATGAVLYAAKPDLFADASRLPLASASVDVVTMFEVTEHLRAPREALHEAVRVLRPGGLLLLSMPFLYPIHDAPHDYQRYTVHGLSRELTDAGLRVEAIEPSLGAMETAGLIATLAIAGVAEQAIRKRSLSVLFIPIAVLVIPAINLLAWFAGRLLPAWDALTAGYSVVARKP